MKVLTLLLVLSASAIGPQAQTRPPTPVQAPLSILVWKWTSAARSTASSSDQEKKGKDAATNQQVALASRSGAVDGNGNETGSGEAQYIDATRAPTLIPLPQGVVKGYLYKAQVRNLADKTIKRLEWSYVFTDVFSQKEIVRHAFYSHTQIRPGETKKLSAFTRGSPPPVINVKELSKNG